MSRFYAAGPEADLDPCAFKRDAAGNLRLYGKGGGGNTQTIQKADPWKQLQPYLLDLYSRGNRWLESPMPQYYPEGTVAGQAPETLTAQYQGMQRALAGSPLQTGAQALGFRTLAGDFLNRPAQAMWDNPWMQNAADVAFDTMQGNYLGANPYLNSMFLQASNPLIDQFSKAIAPSITSQFARGGRYGSGAHEAAITGAAGQLGQALAGMGAQIYGPAYEAERGRQQQAVTQGLSATDMFARAMDAERARQQALIGMGPELAALDYTDLQQLANIGASREQRAQEMLNAEIARWDFGQQQPMSKLQAFNQLLQGGTSFNQQTTTQKAPSTGGFNLSGALGGGLMGMQALPMVGGALAGAGLGMGAGAMGPSAFLAAGAANPAFWPLIIGSALLGGMG